LVLLAYHFKACLLYYILTKHYETNCIHKF
jgi:hypothetical protein